MKSNNSFLQVYGGWIHTGGGFAWLAWRVSCRSTEELGPGRGIWLGSIFDDPAKGVPVWPTADEMVVMDWFGGGGIPYILGGWTEPGNCGGGTEPGNCGGWAEPGNCGGGAEPGNCGDGAEPRNCGGGATCSSNISDSNKKWIHSFINFSP